MALSISLDKSLSEERNETKYWIFTDVGDAEDKKYTQVNQQVFSLLKGCRGPLYVM